MDLCQAVVESSGNLCGLPVQRDLSSEKIIWAGLREVQVLDGTQQTLQWAECLVNYREAAYYRHAKPNAPA